MSDDTVLNMKPLLNLEKALKNNNYNVRIGILGIKDARSSKNGTASNATVGATHEYGTTTVPMRSFLRMPISEEFPKKLEQSGSVSKEDFEKVIATSSFENFAHKIGISAVATVLEAFDTGGFGKWKELSPETLKRKKIKQILVESHQLRDSVTYDIQEKKS